MLAIYTLHFVLRGPVKTSSLREPWSAVQILHHPLTAYFLVYLGPISKSLSIPESGLEQLPLLRTLPHIMIGFTFLGIIEPIRQGVRLSHPISHVPVR